MTKYITIFLASFIFKFSYSQDLNRQSYFKLNFKEFIDLDWKECALEERRAIEDADEVEGKRRHESCDRCAHQTVDYCLPRTLLNIIIVDNK